MLGPQGASARLADWLARVRRSVQQGAAEFAGAAVQSARLEPLQPLGKKAGALKHPALGCGSIFPASFKLGHSVSATDA